MIIVEVQKPQTIKAVTRKSDGKQFHIPEQEGWAHMPGEQYPTKIVIGFSDGHPGYSPGKYKLMPSSLYVDGNGNLGIRKAMTLEPVAAVSASKAA